MKHLYNLEVHHELNLSFTDLIVYNTTIAPVPFVVPGADVKIDSKKKIEGKVISKLSKKEFMKLAEKLYNKYKKRK